ncbi:hypothetical protein LX36DRAFT_658262 [Colletotrichum falcatum]|nr:hypothetical protein LX36DRAFT_658262 [Colletotrichum falcatum]
MTASARRTSLVASSYCRLLMGLVLCHLLPTARGEGTAAVITVAVDRLYLRILRTDIQYTVVTYLPVCMACPADVAAVLCVPSEEEARDRLRWGKRCFRPSEQAEYFWGVTGRGGGDKRPTPKTVLPWRNNPPSTHSPVTTVGT